MSTPNQRVKNLRQAYDYLYANLPMFQRQGQSSYKKDLTNTIKLCAAAGHPESKISSIHIAGTNGKGTTTHLIAAGLQAQGYKVGVYTSPHYRDFRERIKINGQLIDGKYIIEFINKHHEAIKSIQPSFFEMTVALAFSYFADENVDFAVIETGLGGRLDSTNIITPLLSVITNISFDHQNLLGDTLEAIANEKAGIIKSGVPVIIGETQQEISHIFIDKAQETKSTIYFADQHLTAHNLPSSDGQIEVQLIMNGKKWNVPLKTSLAGPFQIKNIVTGMYALYILSKTIKIDFKKVWDFMPNMSASTLYMGRWQILGKHPMILADSAHNEGGLKIVMEEIKKIPYQRLHIVMGFVNDKNPDKVLEIFPKDAKYYFAKANIPRGLEAPLLQQAAGNFGLQGKAYSSVRKALAAAKMSARPEDLIYVGGSIFIVAEII